VAGLCEAGRRPHALSFQVPPSGLRPASVPPSSGGRTRAGHHLAQLPVDAKIGKLLLLGASLGCLGPCLTVGACLSYRGPFAGGFEQQDAAARAKAALAAPGAPWKRCGDALARADMGGYVAHITLFTEMQL
jgi:HrpA-like RNA helicase